MSANTLSEPVDPSALTDVQRAELDPHGVAPLIVGHISALVGNQMGDVEVGEWPGAVAEDPWRFFTASGMRAVSMLVDENPGALQLLEPHQRTIVDTIVSTAESGDIAEGVA